MSYCLIWKLLLIILSRDLLSSKSLIFPFQKCQPKTISEETFLELLL